MSRELWAESIPNAIDKLISGNPNENNAVILAALYALQDRFGGGEALEHAVQGENEALRDESPQGKVDVILNDLRRAFAEYAESKAAHMMRPISENHVCCLKDLDNILNGTKQLLALIVQSSSTTQEREHVKAFFNPYAEKFLKVGG